MTNTPSQATVRLVPPKEFFRAYEKAIRPPEPGSSYQLVSPTIRIDLPEGGGIASYHEGEKYPVKGWPFREAVIAGDMLKRVVLLGIRALKLVPWLPLAVFPPVRHKLISGALALFAEYATLVFDRCGRLLEIEGDDGQVLTLDSVLIRPELYCDMVREVRRVGMELAGDSKDGQTLVEAISHVLEFDDAYRYRVQDVMGELDREAVLARPGLELRRVFLIGVRRGPSTAGQFATFAKSVRFLMLIPEVRRTVRAFFERVDLSKLALDKADLYRCLAWGGYRFKGISDAERAIVRGLIDNPNPLPT